MQTITRDISLEMPIKRGASRRKKKLRRVLKRVRIVLGVVLLLALMLVCASFGADILGRVYTLGTTAVLQDILPAIIGGEAAPVQPQGTAGEAIRLEVPALLQTPELKNGCEATSLAMVLHYMGYPIEKVDVAYCFIPRQDFFEENGTLYGPWPGDAYPGDPGTSNGFYCYAAPLAQAGNDILAIEGVGGRFTDATGADLESFRAALDAGRPVIVWATLNYEAELQYLDFSWTLPDGRTYIPYSNLHCVVLTGYDGGSYTLCDPLEGEITVDAARLAASYEAMGSRAVVYEA